MYIDSERERESGGVGWGGESVRTRKVVSGDDDPMHLAKWVPGRVYLDRRAACC
jgi:hypothetical protein